MKKKKTTTKKQNVKSPLSTQIVNKMVLMVKMELALNIFISYRFYQFSSNFSKLRVMASETFNRKHTVTLHFGLDRRR